MALTSDTSNSAQLAGTNLPGFDPAKHIGTLGAPPDTRHLTREEYDALDDETRMKVQLLAEHLDVTKAQREVGEVEIGKKIVEEKVSVPVTLEHEEVIIHQTKVSGGDAHGAVIGDSQTIKVPLTEEVAQITKTTSVTGEVEIEKRVASEQKTISDTVRREELDVNKGTTGRVTVEDDTKTV